MAETFDELPEWIKLPLDLQHEFFQIAEEEAERLVNVIRTIDENLKTLKMEIYPHVHGFPDQIKRSIVGAVDSSRSPRFSERLGVRYGVFATGIVYLRGTESRREKFKPGIFKRKQALSQDESKYFFPLLTTYCERKMALEALKECDLLFIDGSFYSFIYPALDMKKLGFLESEEKRRILNEVFRLTEELRKSGRVLGVIKRSHTKAIGGYVFFKSGNKTFVNIIDKHILSLIMPGRTFFEYSSILGDKPTAVYTGISNMVSRGRTSENKEELFKMAEEKAYKPFEELDFSKDGFIEMRRAQVRFHGELPPCELEYPSKINLIDVLSEENLFSDVTNLPIALDLVDNLVNISSKFTEEFVSEIEGRVLNSITKNGGNIESTKVFFTFLNPQKPF
ncbi:MAG: DNA double-strand break repair nuclease NurA [Candidatus Bathyarchaeia archaeon]